ncbi:probable UDP-glucosyl transferase 73B6 [Cornus florida]|uniref:probable UDP-glucosyl transferase 73B6 n=1 Tax=Cornus florida TaxID=4283 RepID=UPI0028A0C5AE|nr:probable UDP-glucosyl transferase 73B6 [Cornus florida]
MSTEIFVVPKNGQGHLFPSMELCKHLVSRNYKITLIIDSDISSSVPTSLRQSPLFEIADFSRSAPHTAVSGSDQIHPQEQQMHSNLEGLLTRKIESSSPTRPACAVIDHIMFKTQGVFAKFGVPTVTFITSGACWAAIQHAVWKVQPDDMKPGEIRSLPGLPEEMVLKYSDLKQRRHWMFPAPHGGVGPKPMTGPRDGGSKRPRGPPFPGEPARWVAEVESSIAILINTCDDLERPFLDYITNLTGKPVWGVGPLLPDQYWQTVYSVFQEREIRPERDSNYSEEEIIKWLDSKPRASVFYVSFGSEVGPSMEEYPELANALEESKWPFIWVIQKRSGRPGPPRQPGSDSTVVDGYFPHGLDSRVGERGLIIHGWAPQLLILSHPSTGGFLSHGGWNSTVEAIVRGVPLLAWPIRGDQYYNAKLVVSHLKVGTMVSEGYPADMVKKDDILHGIEMLMTDADIRNRAATVRGSFERGFPMSSVASLDAFGDFIGKEQLKFVLDC